MSDNNTLNNDQEGDIVLDHKKILIQVIIVLATVIIITFAVNYIIENYTDYSEYNFYITLLVACVTGVVSTYSLISSEYLPFCKKLTKKILKKINELEEENEKHVAEKEAMLESIDSLITETNEFREEPFVQNPPVEEVVPGTVQGLPEIEVVPTV